MEGGPAPCPKGARDTHGAEAGESLRGSPAAPTRRTAMPKIPPWMWLTAYLIVLALACFPVVQHFARGSGGGW